MKNGFIKIRTTCLLIGISILIASCATDVANRYYANEKYPPKNPESVAVLKSPPNCSYETIADFQARNASAEWMRNEAAKIGADAVIVQYLGGYCDQGAKWAGDDAQGKTYSRITGTAIKYKKENQ